MKCQQFCEVTFSVPLFYLYYSTSLAHLHNQERNDLKPIHLQTLTSDFFVDVCISQQLNQLTAMFFSVRAAEDVELWFSEVENLLAVEDLGKVCYRLSLESTHVQAVF